MKDHGKEADDMSATVIPISKHPRYVHPEAEAERELRRIIADHNAPPLLPPAPKYRERPSREEAIKRIKVALEMRSGKQWSVTGGRGTAWGWLRIDAPPKERTWTHRRAADGIGWEEYDTGKPNSGDMSPARRAELGTLLGLEGPAHMQGVSIPSGGSYWDEYIERAETGKSDIKSEPYWD